MRITLFAVLLLLSCWLSRAAAPTFQSFEPDQFDTNGLMIRYRADWTNEVGVIRPATVNTEVTVTNLNIYETLVLPAKVYALALGTNELNVATNSSWLLSSPTNDAAQVILSLSAGKFQGQLLLITSQNETGGFTLPDLSEQYDSPGGLVDIQGDWVGTTNRGTLLQYSAPDWIEMFRFDPSTTNLQFTATGVGVTNIANVLSGNYTPGSNITMTTNAYGSVEITAAGGGSGSVTSVSSGNLTNLWTVGVSNPTTTPAFTFTRVDPSANRIVIFDDTDDQYVQGVIGSGLSYDAPSNTLTASGDGTANWTASGITNSLLAGVAFANQLNVTNYITLGNTTNRLSDDGTRITYNGSPLITFVYPIACSDETTVITTGTAKRTFRMPFACTLTGVRASLTTAQVSGSIFTVDINESGATILSTKLTLDNGDTTSVTAAAQPVLSDTAIADDASMTVDVDQVGNGTATGLKIEIYGYQ